MLDTQIWQLLKTFSSKEQRDFKKWINSPFFNVRKNVSALYEYLETVLKETVPNRQNLQAERYRVWEKISGEKGNKKALNEEQNTALNFAAYSLSQNVKAFFIYKNQKENNYEQHKSLAKSYRERQLNQLFEQEMLAWRVSLEAEQKQNSTYFKAKYDYFVTLLEANVAQRTSDLNFEALHENFAHYSIGELLKQWADMSLHSRMTKQIYNLDFIEKSVINYEQNFKNPPVFIQIWLLYFHLSKSKEKTDKYFIFKGLLKENEYIFSTNELKNIYIATTNYCIKLANSGETDFNKELFDWYINGIEKELVFEYGELPSARYKNTLKTGLVTNKNELEKWDALAFIEKYKVFLPKKEREDNYKLALAIYHCKTRNFEAALPILLQYKSKDDLHNLDINRLKAALYYETKDIENLDILLPLFERMIKRKKSISANYRTFNLNFIFFLKKLVAIRYEMPKKMQKNALLHLAKQIKEKSNLADRDWLLEMVERG